MKGVRSRRLAIPAPRAEAARLAPDHAVIVLAVYASLLAVAAIDFWTSAEFIGAIMFTAPLALCALQPSKRLVWTTAAIAGALTIAAGLWGVNRGGDSISPDAAFNRALLVLSLLTLAAFIHLWLRKAHLGASDAEEIRRQSHSLAVQKAELDLVIAAGGREIEVREDAERHLDQMEARYRGLLEAAPDAMVVVDQDGAIILLNLQAEKQFGYRRDELVGQQIKNIIPEGFAERLIADDARSAAEALAQQIGTGIELIGLRKDGGEFPMELMLSPLEDAEGILVTVAIRDVTARRADQDALRASEDWHRMAVEAFEMGTWAWDFAQDEITWSDQFRKMFGLAGGITPTYAAMIEKIHPDDRAPFDRGVKRLTKQGLAYDMEYRIVDRDRGERWIASKGRVRRNLEGMPESLQGTILDITERRAGQQSLRERPGLDRTSAELMRSNADLQQFAYVAAHDLQEPLRMVSSYTQLLASRYKGRLDPRADEYIAFAVDGAKRMHLLIADLLAYCQVGTAGRDFATTASDHALDLALRNLKGALDEGGGVVTRDPLPTLIADEDQMVQLFQNLIGNALKYHGAAAPRVHVSAKKNRAKEWVFSIRDNGLGIEPKYFERIFLVFQRLHGREEFSGTGIGLSLCRKIAERHGGRIWVKSEPGAGSTFYVALPEGGA